MKYPALILQSYLRYFWLLIFFLFFFLLPKHAFGLLYYQPGQDPSNPSATSPSCYDDGGSTCSNVKLNDCTTYGGLTKDNQCLQGPWRFKYAANCQTCLGAREPSCSFEYQYQYNTCSTQDRCYGVTTGASGFDEAGRVLPGICSASSYDGSNPSSACVSGSWYKTCCSSDGGYPVTNCSLGACPSGQITAAGVISCLVPTATPIPPTPTPIPDPCLNAPTGLNRTCSANGASLSFTWDSTGTSCTYAIRIDENPVSWGGDTVLAGDTVNNNVTSASFSRSSTPGQTYTWWLHSVSPVTGFYSPSTTGTNITCPVPPTLPPGVTPTSTPIPTATPVPTAGPTPTTAPSCSCLSGAGSCGSNSRNADFSMPASAWPAGCPVPACSGGWDYRPADDLVCQNNFGTGYYCWQCSVLPTATPTPTGAPAATGTPTPTTPPCGSFGHNTCSSGTSGNVGNCRQILCDGNATCVGTCVDADNASLGTVRSQTDITSCLATVADGGWGGDHITNIIWSPPSSSVCSGPAPTTATYTISGIVFIDRNANGRKEADEVGYSGGARLFLGTRTATTDLINGAYQFTGVTSGSYPLELDMPFGFSPNRSTGYSGGTNSVTRSVGPNATADFGIVPYEVGVGGTMYTTLDGSCSTGITPQGRLGSKSLNLLENYFGLNFNAATDINGAYSFSAPNQTLFPGSYSITPSDVSGARLICAVIDGTTYETVRSTPYTYGDDSGENLTLTAQNPQKRIDFYYQLVQPWFQGQGADMRIDSGFKDPVSASSRSPYAMLSNGQSPGVIFSGGNSYSFCTAGADICLERASPLTDPWVVGGTIFPEPFTPAITGTTRTSYSYLLGLVRQNGQTINEITETEHGDCYDQDRGCDLAALDPGVYTNQTGQNDVYTRSSKSQFNRGDYVFLINGNLHIQGELGLVNTLNDAVLVVSVSGDITVEKDVGGSPSSTNTHLEGLFSADSDFILESEGSEGDNCPSNRDKRLNIKGAIVANALLAGGTFQNNRTLCDDNSDNPTFYIEESPYLILNAPDFIKHKSFVWQEVAP